MSAFLSGFFDSLARAWRNLELWQRIVLVAVLPAAIIVAGIVLVVAVVLAVIIAGFWLIVQLAEGIEAAVAKQKEQLEKERLERIHAQPAELHITLPWAQPDGTLLQLFVGGRLKLYWERKEGGWHGPIRAEP